MIFEIKNSKDLDTKLKKCNNNHHINNQGAKIDKDGDKIRTF